MVNGLHLDSAFLVFWPLSVLLQYKLAFTHLHIPTYTKGRGFYRAKYQPAHQEHTHKHSHTHGRAIRRNLGFNVLPKDTSTHGLEELGIDPQTRSSSWATASPTLFKRSTWFLTLLTYQPIVRNWKHTGVCPGNNILKLESKFFQAIKQTCEHEKKRFMILDFFRVKIPLHIFLQN